jgi:DNA-binding NarL/FixJ family response regulator
MNAPTSLVPLRPTVRHSAPLRETGRPRATRSAPAAIRVSVIASDPISGHGLAAYFQTRPDIAVLESTRQHEAQVAIVVFDSFTDRLLEKATAAALAAEKPLRFVLVCSDLREPHFVRLAALGMVSVLSRRTSDFDQIAQSVLNLHAGRLELPSDAMDWFSKLSRAVPSDGLDPNVCSTDGFSEREVSVLGLLADGLTTEEIAARLNYSERTVKTIIYVVTSRLKLRNRAHAVAFAIRAGVI